MIVHTCEGGAEPPQSPTIRSALSGALTLVVVFGAVLGGMALSVAVAGWVTVAACAGLAVAVVGIVLKTLTLAFKPRPVVRAPAAVSVRVLPSPTPPPATAPLPPRVNAADAWLLLEAAGRPSLDGVTVVPSITSLPEGVAR